MAAVDVCAVVNAMDPDDFCGVVYAVEEAVRPSSGAVLAGEVAAQWFADAAGISRQVAEGELDDCGQDPRR